MKIKTLISTVIALAVSVSILAQSNPGINLLKLGEFELAKQHFTKQISQNPAEANYYLGEVAWENGNMADAKKHYDAALAADAESLLAQIGVAKADLKTNEKEAKKALENIYKKNKKDVVIVLEVAKAFYDNGLVEDGDKAVAEAKKSDRSNALIYILEGDRQLKAGKTGDAAMQYDQAIHFDGNNVLALIKGGKVYETINPSIAIEQFKKAIEIDPSNTLVNRYLAKVYSSSGRYAQAIDMYREYFMNDNYNLEDIRYFATALYFNKNFADAKEILAKGIERDGKNFVFNRLMMYSQNELKDYANGLATAEAFFDLRAKTDSGYIDKDYMTYGELLSENGKTDEALVAYKKAIELNPDNVNLFKELASSMGSNKMNEEAAEFMNHYIEAMGDGVEASDFYTLGRYYQSAGQALAKDSLPEMIEKRIDLYKKADAAFEVVTERLPENYLGYYMRGGVNALLDPELKEGLSKPHYEKMLEVIIANDEVEQRKNIVLTGYQYLAVYHFYKFDDTKSAESKAKALEYCEKYCELNPNNETINMILDNVK